jgi:hypothetical protein
MVIKSTVQPLSELLARQKRIKDAFNLRKPDRVLVVGERIFVADVHRKSAAGGK